MRLTPILKLLSNFILGYKMLSTTCRICDTIEMQDKQDKIFCLACTEIDCQDAVKDNPALSTTAANRTLAESSERQTAPSTSPRSREAVAAEVESQMIPGTKVSYFVIFIALILDL